MHKKKEIVQDVTLNDLDMANARPQGEYLERGDAACNLNVVAYNNIVCIRVILCCFTLVLPH